MKAIYAIAMLKSNTKDWPLPLLSKATLTVSHLKGIGKEFQQLVIRRYLDKSIQKKLILPFKSLQIKTIFKKKSSICEIYCRGICDLYLWS